MIKLRGIFSWLAKTWVTIADGFTPPVLMRLVDERPSACIPRLLYVTTAGELPAFGFMRCPCGCGEILHLRFAGERRPRWRVSADAQGRVSVTPSVWRSTGCKSHFVLTRGRVHWCRDSISR
jgi:hypothetical protein